MYDDKQFDAHSNGDVTVLRLRQRRIIDEDQVFQFGEVLGRFASDEDTKKLVLNFGAVKFLSSAALGRLISIRKQAAQHGAQLKLTNLSPEVHEIFKITRLDEIFEICADESDAFSVF
jgi:anti-sigma B factor antagonist